jgi:hypothetical protein
LLAAYDVTKDRRFLRQAMEKDPTDPRVDFAAFFRSEDYTNSQPATAARRQWLETFAESAPDNALANYLLAFDDFKSGQTDDAVRQLLAAAQKGKFQDYSRDFIQNAEEAYRAAGWSEVEAKTVATSMLELPHLVELKQTGLKTLELALLYRQNGDEASAQAALQLGLGLGQHLTEPGQLSLLQELVGCAIQRKILEAMDPASRFGNAGLTAQNQLDAIVQRQQAIQGIVPREALMPTLSEAETAGFYERMKLLGEDAATQWLMKAHGAQPSP